MYILLQYCESNFKNQNYIKGQLSYFGNKPSFIVHSVLIPLSILPFLLKKRLLNSNNEEKAKSCQVGYMTSISLKVYPLLNKLFQLSLNLLERLVLKLGNKNTRTWPCRRQNSRFLLQLSVFSLAPDLLFDCSRELEYAKIRFLLQFSDYASFRDRLRNIFNACLRWPGGVTELCNSALEAPEHAVSLYCFKQCSWSFPHGGIRNRSESTLCKNFSNNLLISCWLQIESVIIICCHQLMLSPVY